MSRMHMHLVAINSILRYLLQITICAALSLESEQLAAEPESGLTLFGCVLVHYCIIFDM